MRLFGFSTKIHNSEWAQQQEQRWREGLIILMQRAGEFPVSNMARTAPRIAIRQTPRWNLRRVDSLRARFARPQADALNLHLTSNVHAPRPRAPRACSVRACSVFLGTRGGPPPPLVRGCARAARASTIVPHTAYDDDDDDSATPTRPRAARRFNEHALGARGRSLSTRRASSPYVRATASAIVA
jgi:hypothetical protein